MPRPITFDKERVLNQAMMRFWRHGYTATSMKQLEAATKLTPGSLYNSFGSKDGLFLAALDHYVDTVIGARVQHFLLPPYRVGDSDADAPLAGVEAFIEHCFSGSEEHQHLGCLVVNSATELGPHDQVAREKINRALAKVLRALAKALLRAQQAGDLDQAIDTKQRAQMLGLLLNGMLVQWRSATHTRWLPGAMTGVRQLLQ